MSLPHSRRLRLGFGLGLLGGCGPVADDRDAWLWHTIVLDNQDFLERDPDLVAGKFAKMSETRFGFFRGTAAQFARDMFEPGGAGAHAWALAGSAPFDVALVGDPHPENFGTYRRSDGRLTADFNDFDATTYGPLEFDVRRLALGFWVACTQVDDALAAEGHDELAPDCDAVTAAVPRAYADELAALRDDPTRGTVLTEDAENGAVITELFADARRDGDDATALADYTRVEGDRRVMFAGEVAPARIVRSGEWDTLVFEDSVRPVDRSTRQRIELWVQQWRNTLVDPDRREPGAVLGASLRLGAGVSSYAQYRWYVLLDGPTAAIDDDFLIEIKETRDALPMPGARRPIDAPFDGNGPRVVGLQRELQGFVDDDPWLGWASAGAMALRVRERTSYQRGFAIDDIAPAIEAGDWVPDDVVAFAGTCGRVLARSHARARRASGHVATDAIASAVGDGERLVDSITSFVADYGPIVLDDHRRWRALLAEHGPDLGYGE